MDFKSEIVSLFDYYDAPGARNMADRVKRGEMKLEIYLPNPTAQY